MSSKRKNSKSDLIRLSLTLFGITSVVALLLAFANGITAPIIEQSKVERLNYSLNKIVPDASEFEIVGNNPESVVVGNATVPVLAVYSAKTKDNSLWGYCVQVAPMGYSDKIEMLVAVDLEGTVRGVRIISISDTPGIGLKVQTDEDFQNKVLGLNETMTPVKTAPQSDGEVQVISGASVSSTAYIHGVNAAIEVVHGLI